MSLDARHAWTLDQLIAAGEPQFFSADPLYYKSLLVAKAEALMERKLYEGQVEMYMIEIMAYALQVRGAEQQLAVIQRLLPFAGRQYLDILGARLNTYRLAAATATLTVRFTLAAPRPSTTIIPAGTRVRTAGSAMVFLTGADLLVQPGLLAGEVAATAAEGGVTGAAASPGDILTILDPEAGVAAASVINFSDGTDEEHDTPFRQRIAGAWELVSRGGPRAGYRQIALGAHPAVLDVAIIRPQPCDIDIYVLTEELPLPTVVADAVLTACDPRTARPEGDEVKVWPATAVTFAPTLRLWVDGDAAIISAQAEATARGVFSVWRRTLGARVSTAAITSPVKQIAGVVEAEIEGYSYNPLAESEFAVLTSLNVVVEAA